MKQEFNMQYLIDFLKKRIQEGSEESYTVKIAGNQEKLFKKILEEAFEVTQAKQKDEMIWEIADLLYFVSIYMAKNNLDWQEIINKLASRHK